MSPHGALPERFRPTPPRAAMPLRQRRKGHGEPLGHDVDGNIVLKQVDRAKAPSLELSRTPPWAHAGPSTEDNRILLTQESLVT